MPVPAGPPPALAHLLQKAQPTAGTAAAATTASAAGVGTAGVRAAGPAQQQVIMKGSAPVICCLVVLVSFRTNLPSCM